MQTWSSAAEAERKRCSSSHPDPEIISLRLMFPCFGLSQLMPVKSRFPFEVHTLHHLFSPMPGSCLYPGVWSSTQTTSQPSWLWQWAWPTLVCATMLARPCSAGYDIIQSTSTFWRARPTWWDPQTPNAGCPMLSTWADTKGGVFRLNRQFNNTLDLMKAKNGVFSFGHF